MQSEEINKLANFCDRNLELNSIVLGEEYFYQNLPLCVIDAVFSIGVRYEGVKNVIRNYCDYFEMGKYTRQPKEIIPPQAQQKSIRNFLDDLEKMDSAKSANEVFRNRQRTSTKSGILKAEAVERFASSLSESGVDYLQDIPILMRDIKRIEALEKRIKSIPGQGSGISG